MNHNPVDQRLPDDRDLRIIHLAKQAANLQKEHREAFLQQHLSGDAEAISLVYAMLTEHDSKDILEESLDQQYDARSDHENRIPPLSAGYDVTTELSEGSSADTNRVEKHTEALPEIPGYKLRRVIGRGGMGLVVDAFDEGLQRDVAIKLIRESHLQSKVARHRFLQEARAVAKVRHPNVVGILQEGVTETGVSWFAMERVAGQPLNQILAKESLSIDTAVRIGIGITDGLAASHVQGILHRDIKPGNVIVQPNGSPVLIDFGLAKNLQLDASLTQTGVGLGTPAYMAPEQISDTFGEVSPATDIYGVGGVLFAMLLGRPPFEADDAYSLLQATLHQSLPSLRTSRSEVPKDLDSIVRKCLEKRSADRYASANDLLHDLKRFNEGLSVGARPIGPVIRLGRWAAAYPLAVMAFSVVVCLLLGVLHFYNESKQSESLAKNRAADLKATTQQVTRNAEVLAKTNDHLQQQIYDADFSSIVSMMRMGKRDTAYHSLLKMIPESGEPDRRGIEWYLAWSWLHGPHQLAHGGSHRIKHVDVSPDGCLLAYRLYTSGVLVWDYRKLELVKVFRSTAHGQIVLFNHDGSLLITNQYNRLLLWNTRTWKLERTIQLDLSKALAVDAGLASNVIAISRVSPERKNENELLILDLDDGQILHKYEHLSTGCREVRLSPDEQWVAWGGEAAEAELINLTNKSRKKIPAGWVFSFNDDCSQMLYSAGLYDLYSGTLTQTPETQRNQFITRVRRFRPGHKQAVACTWSQIEVCDSESWTYRDPINGSLSIAWAGEFSPSGDRLIVVGEAGGQAGTAGGTLDGGGVMILDADNEYENLLEGPLLHIPPLTREFSERELACFDVSESGNTIYIGHISGGVSRADIGVPGLHTLSTSNVAVQNVVACGESCCIFLDTDGNASRLDWDTEKQVALTHDATFEVLSSGANEGDVLLSRGQDVFVYEPQVDRLRPFVSANFPVQAITADNNGIFIAGDGKIARVDLEGKTIWQHQVRQASGRQQGIGSSGVVKKLLPLVGIDSENCFVANSDGEIVLVNRQAGPEQFSKVPFAVHALSVVDHGKRLIVAADQEEDWIIDIQTRRTLLEMESYGHRFGLQAARDGMWLVSAGGNSDNSRPRLQRFVRPTESDIVMQLIHDQSNDLENSQIVSDLQRQLAFLNTDPKTTRISEILLALRDQQTERNTHLADSYRATDSTAAKNQVRFNEAERLEVQQRIVDLLEQQLRLSETDAAHDLSTHWRLRELTAQADVPAALLKKYPMLRRGETEDPADWFASFLADLPVGEPMKISDSKGLRWGTGTNHKYYCWNNRDLRRFDLLTGKFETLAQFSNPISDVLAMPNGQQVYVCTGGRWDMKLNRLVNELPIGVYRLDTQTWTRTMIQEYPDSKFRQLCLSSDGSQIVAVCEQRPSIMFDTEGHNVRQVNSLTNGLKMCWFLEPGTLGVIQSYSGLFKVSIAEDKQLPTTWLGIDGVVQSFVSLPAANMVAAVYCPKEIAFIDPKGRRWTRRHNADFGYETAIVAGPNQKSIVAGTTSGQLIEMSIEAERPVVEHKLGTTAITGIAMLDDEQTLLVSDRTATYLYKLPGS